MQSGSELAAEVAQFAWYHTIELPGGVTTPGIFDHRALVPYYGLPVSLEGKTALDVATFDGFWAFELERRGADVTALDIAKLSDSDMPPAVRALVVANGFDRPMGMGFDIAQRVLGSRVKRLVSSVYDLDPETHGTFDIVHAGDLLLHLERPLDALRRIHSVTRERAVIVDCYDDLETKGKHTVQYLGGWWANTWWLPSLDALGQIVLDAGFSHVDVHVTYNLAAVDEESGHWRAVFFAQP